MLIPDNNNSALKPGRLGPFAMMLNSNSVTFTPQSLLKESNVCFLLDSFESEITKDEKGMISRWKDIGPRGYDFIQTSVNNRPSFVGGIVRSGAGRLYTEKNIPALSDNPGYLAMFCKVALPAKENGGLVVLGTSTTDSTGQRALLTMANNKIHADLRANGISSTDAPLSSEKFSLYEAQFGGKSISVSHNAGAWDTRAVPAATTPASGAQLFWGTTGVAANVDAVAVIYVDRHLNDKERYNLFNYYSSKIK